MTVNVDVVAPHGVTLGGPVTMNLSPPATTNARTKSIRRTGMHVSDTQRPRYADHETVSSLGATRTAGGRSRVVGSDAGGVVVALGGISEGLGTTVTAAGLSWLREADGGPAEPPASQATQQ